MIWLVPRHVGILSSGIGIVSIGSVAAMKQLLVLALFLGGALAKGANYTNPVIQLILKIFQESLDLLPKYMMSSKLITKIFGLQQMQVFYVCARISTVKHLHQKYFLAG